MKLRYAVASALAIGVFATASPAIANDSVSAAGSGGVDSGRAAIEAGSPTADAWLELTDSSGKVVANASFHKLWDLFVVCANDVGNVRLDVRKPTGNNTSEHLFFVSDDQGGECGSTDNREHNLAEMREYLVILESNDVKDTGRQFIYA